jgi:TonB family protein
MRMIATRRNKRFALIVSLLAHAGAISVLAGWATPHTARTRFAGQRVVIELRLPSESNDWQTPPTTVIDTTAVDTPVVVEPTQARIARQRFVETPTYEVAAAEFMSDVHGGMPAASPPRSAERNEPVNPAAEPVSTAMPRRRSDQQPAIAAEARLPQQLGTDAKQPPSFVGNAPPHYPDTARRQGWEGEVLLRLFIAADGAVQRVEIARSSGYEVLDGAAVTAVRRWRGSPAMQSGRPIETVELLPVRFKLR